jgi:hypothetical protein
MTELLIPRPDERSSFQSYFATSLLRSLAHIGRRNRRFRLAVSLCAAIYGLDLSAGLP